MTTATRHSHRRRSGAPGVRRLLIALVGLAAGLVLALGPAPAWARDDTITSFDGTKIALSFFPADGLAPGAKAPTVLVGPGWGVPRDTNPSSQTLDNFGTI